MELTIKLDDNQFHLLLNYAAAEARRQVRAHERKHHPKKARRRP